MLSVTHPRFRKALLEVLVATSIFGFASPAPSSPRAPTTASARALPARLSDSAFWRLQADLSEPGGWFRLEDKHPEDLGRLLESRHRLGAGPPGLSASRRSLDEDARLRVHHRRVGQAQVGV